MNLPSSLPLLPFANYASLHRVLSLMRESAWDMIFKVVLRVIVLTLQMRTEKKYPTSKNISNRDREKRRRIRGRSKKIRRRRVKKKKRMGGKSWKGRGRWVGLMKDCSRRNYRSIFSLSFSSLILFYFLFFSLLAFELCYVYH
jgi:DNA repair photolyase